MEDSNQIDPGHDSKRAALRVLGPALMVLGGIFAIVGFVSFFSAFGGSRPPRYFWCVFVGFPLLGIGGAITKIGYADAVARYMANEYAPVAKDTVNYLGPKTSPGVKAVARAIGEGLAEGSTGGAAPAVRCHKCNAPNDADAKFCSECGAALLKSRPCPSCDELNDADAKFCDNCGAAIG